MADPLRTRQLDRYDCRRRRSPSVIAILSAFAARTRSDVRAVLGRCDRPSGRRTMCGSGILDHFDVSPEARPRLLVVRALRSMRLRRRADAIPVWLSRSRVTGPGGRRPGSWPIVGVSSEFDGGPVVEVASELAVVGDDDDGGWGGVEGVGEFVDQCDGEVVGGFVEE